MAKGRSRRGKEDRKPKQKKTKPAPSPSFGKVLSIETSPKAKKN